MKKYLRWSFLFVFLFLIGCISGDVPIEGNCPIEELLLSEADYPPDTILNDVNSPVAEMPLESASISTNYHNNASFQEVARFSSEDNARKEYEKVEKLVFSSLEVVGNWEELWEQGDNKFSADNQRIACGNIVSFGNRCYFVGQYREYYLYFMADISTKGIDYELFKILVSKIDNEMTSCLER